ncbi:MAG TPA: GPW/gp25 family protein [Pilimelia sp.]|nr:GPW/gp25 family protein [Pilimelia sp.]
MHLDFPFRIDAHGATAGTTEDDYVRDLVEQVLFTAPGERVNRPTFGSGVLRLVFEPGSDELATATEFVVQGALQQWLADVVEVQAVEVTSEDSTLRVAVRYRPRRSGQPRTAVFTRPV